MRLNLIPISQTYLQEEMDECRKDELNPTNITKIRELKMLTMEVETVYVEFTTIVQQVRYWNFLSVIR